MELRKNAENMKTDCPETHNLLTELHDKCAMLELIVLHSSTQHSCRTPAALLTSGFQAVFDLVQKTSSGEVYLII